MNEHQELIISMLIKDRDSIAIYGARTGHLPHPMVEKLEKLNAAIEWVKAQGWRPISEAPTKGLIRILVEDVGGERRVFAAEASFDYRSGDMNWIITTGWIGWVPLDSGWNVIGWKPLHYMPPQLPE